MEEVKKYYLFKDSRKENTLKAPSAFYITIGLVKTNNIIEYSDVVRQDDIQTMERQEINPYFIELGFFDEIKRNKVNYGIELTPKRIQFIRNSRPDISVLYQFDDQIQQWFDINGKFELPWGDITIDDLDKSDPTTSNIISKASIYPIDINN